MSLTVNPFLTKSAKNEQIPSGNTRLNEKPVDEWKSEGNTGQSRAFQEDLNKIDLLKNIKAQAERAEVFEKTHLQNNTSEQTITDFVRELSNQPANSLMEKAEQNKQLVMDTVNTGGPQGLAFSELVKRGDPDYHLRPKVQKELKYIDPEADAHLIRMIDRAPERLIHDMFSFGKKKVKIEKPDFTTGKEKPVNIDALCNKFIKIIQENPDIKPSLGQEHKWSPDAEKYMSYGKGFWQRVGAFMRGEQDFPAPTLGGSKLFIMLACGLTPYLAQTGQEEKLEKKIMEYADRSVKIDDVLRESYVLNKGDLYLTLLTAENVLGRDFFDADRGNRPLQKKLQYIRNDSKPEGDNFGAWYHFAGLALYSLVRPEWMAKSVAAVETFGSLFTEKKDKQENHINRLGVEFGSKLKKMIEEENWKNPLPPTADLEYMTLNEFAGGK